MTAAKGMQNRVCIHEEQGTAAAAHLTCATFSHIEKEGKGEQSVHYVERGNKSIGVQFPLPSI